MHDITKCLILSYHIPQYFTEGVGIQTLINVLDGLMYFTFIGRDPPLRISIYVVIHSYKSFVNLIRAMDDGQNIIFTIYIG